MWARRGVLIRMARASSAGISRDEFSTQASSQDSRGDSMRIEKDVAPGAEAATLLQRKLEDKTAQVGVIGLSYVGLPLALLFARKGFPTTGLTSTPPRSRSSSGRKVTSPTFRRRPSRRKSIG